MTAVQWTFDLLLGAGLLWLAWRALVCPDLFRAIVLFIAFGLLMALAWVRLAAPDIALAEAAIGAGLTGALLLAALAQLRVAETAEDDTAAPEGGQSIAVTARWLAGLLVLMVAVGLAYVVTGLSERATGLDAEVAANLAASGVSNPVTAVLLNYRGYDTLLEVFVLLLALLGVWSLGGVSSRRAPPPGQVLDTLVRLLVPLMMLVSAYLLWVGAHAPGGAFQAGSVLGAAGVLLLLSGWRLRAWLVSLPMRLVLVAGPGVFLVMAVVTLLIEGQLLEYPVAYASALILVLEAMATLSIGLTLAALFLGGYPQAEKEQ